MAAYYYTTTDEEPNVYHSKQGCYEGQKIADANRVDTDSKPSGRALCDVCATG
jgi:hypothetical protein